MENQKLCIKEGTIEEFDNERIPISRTVCLRKDCIFYQNENVCICLKKKKCKNCKFYKNKNEYKKVYENHKYVGVTKNGNDDI